MNHKDDNAVIIQARMGSSRLPGKILMEVKPGITILDVLLRRLSKSKFFKQIIIATTNNDSDDKIVDFAKKNNLECFRGDEDDVLKRYYDCATRYSIKTIARITSDCPLLDPSLLDQAYLEFQKNNLSYITNVLPPSYPDGLDFSIFDYDLLCRAMKEAALDSEREHVVPWMWNNVDFESVNSEFNGKNISTDKDYSSLRWTVDEEVDLHNLKNILEVNDFNFLVTWEELIKQSEKGMHKQTNSHVIRDEGLKKSIAGEK